MLALFLETFKKLAVPERWIWTRALASIRTRTLDPDQVLSDVETKLGPLLASRVSLHAGSGAIPSTTCMDKPAT